MNGIEEEEEEEGGGAIGGGDTGLTTGVVGDPLNTLVGEQAWASGGEGDLCCCCKGGWSTVDPHGESGSGSKLA